jgi:hypothetical protein
MRLYLDEDMASAHLIRLLKGAGHDVEQPADAGLLGRTDPVQLAYAVHEARVLTTRNYRDFEELHLLLDEARGHHPGILVERREKDPWRNLTQHDIVRALRNIEAAGVPLADQYYVLNHWK